MPPKILPEKTRWRPGDAVFVQLGEGAVEKTQEQERKETFHGGSELGLALRTESRRPQSVAPLSPHCKPDSAGGSDGEPVATALNA